MGSYVTKSNDIETPKDDFVNFIKDEVEKQKTETVFIPAEVQENEVMTALRMAEKKSVESGLVLLDSTSLNQFYSTENTLMESRQSHKKVSSMSITDKQIMKRPRASRRRNGYVSLRA